jgi:hypothetical protein
LTEKSSKEVEEKNWFQVFYFVSIFDYTTIFHGGHGKALLFNIGIKLISGIFGRIMNIFGVHWYDLPIGLDGIGEKYFGFLITFAVRN